MAGASVDERVGTADAAAPSAAERLAECMRPGTLSFNPPPPLCLYIHLPWCLRKCPYCDFNSHQSTGDMPEQRYLDALRADLDAALPFVWGRRVHSVFIGGGTPSLFSAPSIERLLADVRARLPLLPGCEVTLEANPGTFEQARFRAFRAAGVTRLSIGVQSFDDHKLRALGRVHDAAQARAAIDEAARSFETFNVDLMYALPGQTPDELESDLAQALAFEPPHLSVYHLTIEPNTLFAAHPPRVPDIDTAGRMLDMVVERTAAAGLERYEVSAYARVGHACAHNLNYWQFGDYLGIGAGAHSKLTFAHRVVRQVRFRDPARYLAQAQRGECIAQQHEITRAELPFEFMLNALRLRDGFAMALFHERTGLPASAVQTALDEGEQRGLIGRDLHRVWPTARGFDFLSDVQALFLAER
jgi:oxygen-independent coproporphyrinogen-3 oxidase